MGRGGDESTKTRPKRRISGRVVLVRSRQEPNGASDVSFADLESGPLDAESPAAERRTRSRAEPSPGTPSLPSAARASSESSGFGPPRGVSSGVPDANPSTATGMPSVEARACPVVDIDEIEDVTMPTPPRSAEARPARAAPAAETAPPRPPGQRSTNSWARADVAVARDSGSSSPTRRSGCEYPGNSVTEYGRKATVVESTEVESVAVPPAVGSVPAADPRTTTSTDLLVCDCVEDF